MNPRFKQKVKQEPRSQSPDDEWLSFATTQVANAMRDWLKSTVNVKRPICTLTPAELKALAGCAMAQHSTELERRELTQRPYPSLEEISTRYLFGG